MQVNELQQKTDKQLKTAYTILKKYILENSDSFATEFENTVNHYVEHQYYRARKMVKQVRVLLYEVERICSIRHEHESTVFWTEDKNKYQQIINLAFS